MKRFLPAMLVLLLCFSLAACGSDSGSAQSDTAYPENETTALSLEESITKSNPNTVKDVGSFEGFWMSEETDQYDFIVFDEDGNWSLCKGVDEIDKGYLYYDNETDATCLHSDMGGAADGGRVELEGSRIYITTLGYFNGAEADDNQQNENDLGIPVGFWMSDETDQYDYIAFNEDGSWSLCKGVNEIDKGYFYYDNETDATCLRSEMGGAADGGSIELEGSRLYITTLGYFHDAEEDENQQNKNDFGIHEGFWLSEVTDQYDYIVFDGEGNWSLCKGVDEIDKGYLYYDKETDAIYLHSDMGGAADGGCIELEGSRLYITTLGYFKDGV